MQIELHLAKLGLSDNEVRVYLALLKAGETNAYQLAKVTGLSQPSVHYLLEALRGKGLVLKTPRAGKHMVRARDPREFLEDKKKDIGDIEQMLPQLLALAAFEEKPSISYFDGVDGLRESAEYMLGRVTSGELVGFYRYSPDGIDDMTRERNEYLFTTLGERGIHIRAMQPDVPDINHFMQPYIEKYGWEFKYLPTSVYAPLVSTNIIGNMVMITASRKRQVLVIENNDIADAERMKFELIWKSVKAKP